MKKGMMALVLLSLMACGQSRGGDKGTPAGAAGNGADEIYECEHFSMTVADGWEAGPLTFGMVNVLPKGKVSPGLYFKFEGDGNAAGSAEASIASMIQNYGGSPMEDASIAGTVFKTTTYTYGGMTQTMHVAFREGTKVTITIEGQEAKSDPGIQAMLKSVVLK
ncbi:MAG: hypothetical protein JXO51_04630 [Candidatus Aminicenantes bacterium]|nr:hypothetical protein [Candidatus Aminicenantes bacterium]